MLGGMLLTPIVDPDIYWYNVSTHGFNGFDELQELTRRGIHSTLGCHVLVHHLNQLHSLLFYLLPNPLSGISHRESSLKIIPVFVYWGYDVLAPDAG